MQKTRSMERALEERDGVIQARLDQKLVSGEAERRQRLAAVQQKKEHQRKVQQEQGAEVEQRAVEWAKKMKAVEAREVAQQTSHERKVREKKVDEQRGVDERQEAHKLLKQVATITMTL
jgi:hypothetical protein